MSMPIAPGTLFAPQPMSNTREARVAAGAGSIVSVLLIDSCSRSRPLGLDGSESAMNLLFPALAFQVELGVHLRVQILEFLVQLNVIVVPVRVQRPARKSFFYRAARLLAVTAVAEMTRGGDRFYVAKGFAQRPARVPELQLS